MRDPNPFRDEPGDWSDAFNRIPMESPERDAWSRLASEIRPHARPARRMSRWAAAAAIAALAIAAPLAWFARDPAAPDAPLLATQASMPRMGANAPLDSASVPSAHAVDSASNALSNVAPQARRNVAQVSGSVVQDHRGAAATPVAPAATARGHAVPTHVLAADGAAIPQEPLPAMYAESARLEALLAEIQDDRVSSGPAAALSAQYESRLAAIDASLSDAALSDDLRTALWGERVDALHELVGFEATQRWLNARGERYDSHLVAVY